MKTFKFSWGFLAGLQAVVFYGLLVLAVPWETAKAAPLGYLSISHTGFGAYDDNGITVWGGGLSGIDVYGGVYMLEKSNGVGQGTLWPDGPVGGFCIDLHQLAPETKSTYSVNMPEKAYNSYIGDLIGVKKADYLSELWGRFYNSAWSGSGSFTSAQNQKAEAFAAAVWEIIYEDKPLSPLDWDVTKLGSVNGFRSENVDSVTANKWLWALDGTGPKADLRVFSNCAKQDFLVQVPEPATIALLGIGGVFSLLSRKRKTG